MLGLPWWLWGILLVAAAAAVLHSAARAWRATVRRELIEYLRREVPDLEVVAERAREIEVRKDGTAGTLVLDRFFAEASRIRANDGEGKEALFARFAGMVRESAGAAELDPGRDRPRVRPRVVRDAFVARLNAARPSQAVPALPSGVPGLTVVLVLDSENSVAYVTDAQLKELGLTPEDALALARENLSHTLDAQQIVRRAIEGSSINVVKSGDTFDAARVLLVPECLREGEEIAALIPDRDTLVLTSVPTDGDWSALRKLARAADGEPLWTEPLLVRRAGIVPVPGKTG